MAAQNAAGEEKRRAVIEGQRVVSARGAVAAYPAEAAQIGARIFDAGGNAADAVAAACIAGCMLNPSAAGLAGYVGCAVVLSRDDRGEHVWSVDSNSVAPVAAHQSMFEVMPPCDSAPRSADTRTLHNTGINENEYSCSVKDDANVIGPLAVAVPGVMGCIGILWERWGRLEWSRLVEPSLALLENGLQVEGPGGMAHRPEMSKTLADIAKAGWRDFYEGELGRSIADALQQAGGIVTRDDMAAFEPRVTEPYRITYRNGTVYSPILPNGALSSLQILNMMNCFDALPDDDVRYWHTLAEILKLAWRDRLDRLGDPDFTDVPVSRLLSEEYARERVESIRRSPDHVDTLGPGSPADPGEDTFHFSSADTEGNAVSVTLSHGGNFGSHFVVPGKGLVLGHGMCRFDPHPGLPNSVAGGKRPLNNTAPLLVRLADRDVAVGLPGGRRIVSVAPQLVRRIVDLGMSGHEACVSPRLHVSAHEPVEISENASADLLEALCALGHDVRSVPGVAGTAHCAEILHGEKQARAGGNGWAAGSE